MFLSHPISDHTSLFSLFVSQIGFLDIWTYCSLIFFMHLCFCSHNSLCMKHPFAPPLPCELYSSTRPSSNAYWVLDLSSLVNISFLCAVTSLLLYPLKSIHHIMLYVFSLLDWVNQSMSWFIFHSVPSWFFYRDD